MKRVILSGGGTGGHIYPAITIAQEMAKIEPTEFLYVGSPTGLEAELVPQEGLPFETLDVRGLARRLTIQNVLALYKSSTAMIKAASILHRFKPDVVIGTGGYVCGPILLTAALLGIPTLIQEQNVVAGITNRILGRFVDVVAVGYDEAKSSFGRCKRVEVTGNPVRPDVIACERSEGRRYFNLHEDDFAVLVAGGSRGARSINTAMISVHEAMAACTGTKIIHVTGRTEYDNVLDSLGIASAGEAGTPYGENSLILPYLHDMPKALSAADLAVFRAGAVGLAELTVRGIPSILVPYPYASEDHQTYNAKTLVRHGAARMIVDRVLTGQDLLSAITQLESDRVALRAMGDASRRLGNPEAARDIATLAFSIAK